MAGGKLQDEGAREEGKKMGKGGQHFRTNREWREGTGETTFILLRVLEKEKGQKRNGHPQIGKNITSEKRNANMLGGNKNFIDPRKKGRTDETHKSFIMSVGEEGVTKKARQKKG